MVALEGGYNLSSIAASYAACVAVLLGDPPMPDWPARYPRQLKKETRPLLKEVLVCAPTQPPPSTPFTSPRPSLSDSNHPARPLVCPQSPTLGPSFHAFLPIPSPCRDGEDSD